MISRLFREYKERLWPFYFWDPSTSSSCFDPVEAKKWYSENEFFFEDIEIIIPPQKIIKIRVPVKDEWEEDDEFEKVILSDIRIDPIIRTITNKLLQSYKYCKWWFFVRKQWFKDKMHTKDMEILQLMKDVILWYVRYEPIKLEYYVGKWTKKRLVEYDWDIAEDFNNVEYHVGWKKHKTNIFWAYTRKLRKAMLQDNPFEFYWWHELQYRQRYYDLNYWAINYLCASRASGKTLMSMWRQSMYMFKSITSKAEKADDGYLTTYLFTPVESVIPEYAKKIKKMFYNLLVKTYELWQEAANQIIEWKSSENKMLLKTSTDDRPFIMYSERAVAPRWWRAWIANIDEANYLKNYQEVSAFATKSGAQTIHNISTISQDSKQSLFYKNRVDATIATKKLKPIDEVIHHVWVKFWFDKIKSRDDYKKFVEEWIFDKAKVEFYKLRPVFWMKTTLDDLEIYTEEEKKNMVETELNSVNWYDWMLAEYYCELSPEKPVIRYKPNIIDEKQLPRMFDKIYAWYDEAEQYDHPSLIIWWLSNWVIYVLEQHDLPKTWEDERYKAINEILGFWVSKSWLKPSLIIDIWRWPIYFREASRNVEYCDMAIKTRSGSSVKEWQTAWVFFYQVGTEYLVRDLVNNELIWGDKLFFSLALSSDDNWLFEQLDNYIKDKWTYKWKWHKSDDKVTAFLYMCYYAYMDWIKWNKTIRVKQEEADPIKRMGIEFEKKHIQMNTKKKAISLRSMW